ncbi:hypothetical protein H7H48_03800 [Nitratireductor sp. B36]|nr:hypothetical protein [Nitratireductor sp. B36]
MPEPVCRRFVRRPGSQRNNNPRPIGLEMSSAKPSPARAPVRRRSQVYMCGARTCL